MNVDLASMVEYIVKRSEQEGHFSYFESRGRIWQMIKESELLGDFVEDLRSAFVELLQKYKRADDGYIHLQMKWLETVSSYVDDSTANPLASKLRSIVCPDLDSQSRIFHLSSILHTVAAHEFTYLHQSTSINNEGSTETVTKKTGRGRNTPQTASGIQRMASAIIGQMFKFYKKRRATSASELKVMASMTVVSKQAQFLTVEQRARDRGGLYVMSPDFLPALKPLDKAIREELFSAKHGKEIVKVCLFNNEILEICNNPF